ncbi:MAG: type VI secretion system contractile sheath large subunit [Nannocystis sp.]|nr:type VI secretion system contractile sheath large subunit [Nannocystis sp.]MBA3545556.1 type VI secretion system contractile sheath large subunit [Nannocystis sp.]
MSPNQPSRALIDRAIAELDRRLARTLRALLQHPAVQHLESLWRALHRLLEHARPHDNIRVDLLCCSQAELQADFERAGDPSLAGLHHLVYIRAYASFGGRPYGLLCAAYRFGPDADDLELLRRCAAVAALAHAPFIADVAPALLGLHDLTELTRLRDLPAAQSGPRFAAWQAFRASPDARHVVLCLPRFLLRAPYSPESSPNQPLRFREPIDHPDQLLWGPAALLLAMRTADAFAEQRWCAGLVGTRGGPALLRLIRPVVTHCTLELLLPPRCERDLADAGLLAFTVERTTGRAIVREAPSVQRLGDRLAAQLPYVLLVSRLAHYLQRVQRERVGQWDDRAALQRELDLWLRQYVADMDDPPPEVRARKPLRRASVTLDPNPDQAGWHRCHLSVVPHLTHLGRPLTLKLIGRLERSPR